MRKGVTREQIRAAVPPEIVRNALVDIKRDLDDVVSAVAGARLVNFYEGSFQRFFEYLFKQFIQEGGTFKQFIQEGGTFNIPNAMKFLKKNYPELTKEIDETNGVLRRVISRQPDGTALAASSSVASLSQSSTADMKEDEDDEYSFARGVTVADDTQLSINSCVSNINKKGKKGGLSATQICLAVQHMVVDVAQDQMLMKSEDATVAEIPYTMHQNTKAKVVNVARILNFSDKLVEQSISQQQFQELISGMGDSKCDCIQMPVIINEMGRKHYVQLQIFKKDDNTIGARVIDSTPNPRGIPTAQVKKMLEDSKVKLVKLLGVTELASVSVCSMHTNVQYSDKKCGMYVMSGMRATTNMMLAGGKDFLTSDAETKNIIQAEHKCVDNTLPENYLESRINANAVVASASEKKSKYTELNEVIEKIDESKLIRAVGTALQNYTGDPNRAKIGTSFFRQLSNAGLEYADAALSRLNAASVDQQPAVAKQIAKEILSQGLKSDGSIEIKENSRVHWLLLEMKTQGFISVDVVPGINVKLQTAAAAGTEPPKPS